MSTALIGVVAQTLIPRIGGGRVAAYEVLVVTPGIANLIRENKTFRISSAIQTGAKFGMQLMDDALFNLWKDGKVTVEDILAKSHRRMTSPNESSMLVEESWKRKKAKTSTMGMVDVVASMIVCLH